MKNSFPLWYPTEVQCMFYLWLRAHVAALLCFSPHICNIKPQTLPTAFFILSFKESKVTVTSTTKISFLIYHTKKGHMNLVERKLLPLRWSNIKQLPVKECNAIITEILVNPLNTLGRAQRKIWFVLWPLTKHILESRPELQQLDQKLDAVFQ